MTNANMLFVAESWSAGADPAVYFTTIQAAINQAATLSPSDVTPVTITILPGTYNEDLTLVSNVFLFGKGRRGTILTGTITWNAGAGVNAAYAAIHEEIEIFYMKIESSVVVNTVAKTGSLGVIDIRDSTLTGDYTHTGRLGGDDGMNAFNSVFEGNIVFDNLEDITWFSTSYYGQTITCNGSTSFEHVGGQLYANTNFTLDNTSSALLVGLDLIGTFNVNSGCSFAAYQSLFESGALTVAAGGSGDVRGSNIGSLSLGGAGTIDRSTIQMPSGTTAAGDNTIAISPPLPNASYQVLVTPRSVQTGNMAAYYVGLQTGAGFVLNDSAGGRNFDLQVTRI